METIIEKVMLLQNVEIFSDIPTEQLSYLAAIAKTETFEKGDRLFRENDPSADLYIIGSGSVHLYRNDQYVNKLGANEAVGVLGFFDQKTRLFDAVCQEPCNILVINNSDFFDLLEDRIHITRYLLQYFVTELRNFYNKNDLSKKFA